MMESEMKHHSNSRSENMHGLLECIIVQYANRLRVKYPGRKIQNAAVFASAIQAFAQYGYIELVNAKTGIPKGIPEFLIDTIKRSTPRRLYQQTALATVFLAT